MTLTNFPAPTVDTNVANRINLSGSGLVKLASQLVAQQAAQNTAPSGTQFKPWFGSSFPGGADYDAVPGDGISPAGSVAPNLQYGLTLSVSGANCVAQTCVVTPTVYDDIANVQSGSATYTVLGNTSAGYYNPSELNDGYPALLYSGSGQIVSISGSTITALHRGSVIVEVSVPYVNQVVGSAPAVFTVQIAVEVLA